jgi:hypothetical protein
MTVIDPNDPLYSIVVINGVELRSDEVMVLRTVVDLTVASLNALPFDTMLDKGSHARLLYIQKLLADGE